MEESVIPNTHAPGPTPSSSENLHISRIAKVDANQLDNEIHKILKSEFHSCFQHINPTILNKIQPEIDALFKLLLLKNSVFTKDATLGHQMLNIKYKFKSASNLQGLLYIAVAVFVPWLFERLEGSRNNAVVLFQAVFSLVSIWNFLKFLTDGKYPTLKERIVNAEIVPCGVNKLRQVSFEFLNRELLWHGVMDLLKCLMPHIPKWKQYMKVSSLFNKSTATTAAASEGCCTLCHRHYVMPHVIGCQHPYCYYCLMNEVIMDSSFKCLVCGYSYTAISSIKPFIVQPY